LRDGLRGDGPAEMKPVGEIEFVNGTAAMSASGRYGKSRLCVGIVGHADLRLGDGVARVLEAQIAAGDGRYRGIRHSVTWGPQ
jgi:L-fuconolactonase